MATGSNYPTAFDTFADKVTNDYFTVADCNTHADAIEKLETGPLVLNDGSVSAPAYSFMNDKDTGMHRTTTNTLDFATGGAAALKLANGALYANGAVTSGSNPGDVVTKNNSGFKFVNVAGTSSANYGMFSSTSNDLTLAAPAVSNSINLFWGTGLFAWFQVQNSGPGFVLSESSTDHGAPAGNQAVLYLRDNGSGKTVLFIRFGTGSPQIIAVEP